VFGVHGVGGILGTMMAGVFATASVSAAPGAPGAAGLIDGNPAQLGIQAFAIFVVTGWCIAGTWASLKIADLTVGLRVTNEDERQGLDLALHGEALHQ
jgi:Amt family ammonium transporter